MTTHTTVTPYQLASADARTALTVYQLKFIEAMGSYQSAPFYELGAKDTSSALLTKYPIAVGDPIFEKVVGGSPSYKSLGEFFLSFSTDVFGAGVFDKAARLRTAEWARQNWGMQPRKHAAALPLAYERTIAAALMAGETTVSIENLNGATTIKFFSTSHPCDPFGTNTFTYPNLFTGGSAIAVAGVSDAYPGALPFSQASIKTVRQLLRMQRGQNGTDYRNQDLTHVLCGPDLEEDANTAFNDDKIILETGSGATKTSVERANPNKKYKPVKVVVSPYLTELGVWYPVSSDIIGELPWISLTKVPADSGRVAGMPGPAMIGADGLEWTIDDENSEMYKHGNKVAPKGSVAIACQVELGAALTTPWTIYRCKPT
jgi:hypothetical protein